MAICETCGSSSQGNMYLLRAGQEVLVIELGLSWGDTLKALKYDLSNIVACLFTHVHLDHSKSVDKAIKAGLSVYSCADAAEHHKGVKVLSVGKKTRLGGFIVQPIEVPHSVPNYAYLIEHEAMGRLLFVTDCSEFRYRVKGINHFLVEANYDDELIVNRMMNNEANRSQSENHLSLDQCVDVLKNNFGASTQTITLIHLSDGNSDSEMFKKRVIDELGFGNVYIAERGMSVELVKEEF